jgi:hypothetical protein
MMRQLLGIGMLAAGIAMSAMTYQIAYFVVECLFGECPPLDRVISGAIIISGPSLIIGGIILIRRGS